MKSPVKTIKDLQPKRLPTRAVAGQFIRTGSDQVFVTMHGVVHMNSHQRRSCSADLCKCLLKTKVITQAEHDQHMKWLTVTLADEEKEEQLAIARDIFKKYGVKK